MKELLFEILKAGTTRRLAAFALVPLLALLKSKFGIDLSAEHIAAVTLSSIIYILQSVWKEVRLEEVKVKTPEDAAEVFRRVSK